MRFELARADALALTCRAGPTLATHASRERGTPATEWSALLSFLYVNQPRVPAGNSRESGRWTAYLGGVAELGDTFFSSLFNVTDAVAGSLIRVVLERAVAAIRALPSLRANRPLPPSATGRVAPGVKPSRDILQPGGARRLEVEVRV